MSLSSSLPAFFQSYSFYFINVCLNHTGNRINPTPGVWDGVQQTSIGVYLQYSMSTKRCTVSQIDKYVY